MLKVSQDKILYIQILLYTQNIKTKFSVAADLYWDKAKCTDQKLNPVISNSRNSNYVFVLEDTQMLKISSKQQKINLQFSKRCLFDNTEYENIKPTSRDSSYFKSLKQVYTCICYFKVRKTSSSANWLYSKTEICVALIKTFVVI